jgi:hypothetical protein
MKNKYNFAVRAALLALTFTGAFALNTTAIAQAPPGSLWYNGDFNGVNGLANERNTIITQAAVYDDFNMNFAWNIGGVFTNVLANSTIIGADWEIRTDISEGNHGTLVAHGSVGVGENLIITPTGRSGFGFTEYMVEVTGLNLGLPSLRGTYWLNVTPIGSGTGRSFNSTTSGQNCVGTPCGNDQRAFFNSTYFGAYFTSTSNEGQPYDYSMGVIGVPIDVPIPEPATWSTMALGAVVLIGVRQLRGSRRNHYEK